MKLNYVPAEMTYGPAEIAARNEYIDVLCAEVEPIARDIFKSAVKRQTAGESAETLIDEARAALLDLLKEPEELSKIDDGSRKLITELAAVLKQAPEMPALSTEDGWVTRRSKDLARAVVGFWVNLGENEVSRYEASTTILDEMIVGKESDRRRNFTLIYSRFGLNQKEASRLLSHLDARVVMVRVVETVKPSIQRIEIEALLKPNPFDFEPQPEIVEAVAKNLNIAQYVVRMSMYSKSCEPALKFIKKIDYVNHKQLQRIEKGTAALRKQRMNALRDNVAITFGAVSNAITFCADSKKFNIRSGLFRPHQKKAET